MDELGTSGWRLCRVGKVNWAPACTVASLESAGGTVPARLSRPRSLRNHGGGKEYMQAHSGMRMEIELMTMSRHYGGLR